MSEISYDTLVSQFIDSKIEGDAALFRQATLAFFLKEQVGATAKQIAGDVGYSGRYINILVKTYQAFPTEESRVVDLSFSHHQIAAHSDRPDYWIEQAVINGWSVRELAKAIRGQAVDDEMREADRVYGTVERIFLAGGQQANYLYERLTELLKTTNIE